MRPEMPYLAAGTVAIVGGVSAEKGFPKNGLSAVVATAALVIVASATAGSPVAPLVRAIGLLLLMASVMATTKTINKQRKQNG